MHALVLTLHIIAGGSGIILGFVALFAAKGAQLHRRSGMLFVYAMLTMALVGAAMAAVWGKAAFANVPIGLLTAYLVVTSLHAVRPPRIEWRWVDAALMLVPVAVTVALLIFGVQAAMSPAHAFHGFPAPPFFVFATIALIATAGDARMIRLGGVRALRGTPKIARHLWRMCVALLIAAFSFFLGQAKVIPQPIRILPLLMIPPLVVLFALIYWLWRVRVRRSLRGLDLRAPGSARPAPRVGGPSPRALAHPEPHAITLPLLQDVKGS